MKVTKFLGLSVALLQLIAVLATLVGCSPTLIPAFANNGVAGIWVREDDAHQDWVIEIQETSPGEFEARSLWVPSVARELYSFQVGEKKIRRLRQRKDGTFTLEGLVRFEDGSPSYRLYEATLATNNRLIIIEENSQGQIGDRQVWRRVDPQDVAMAYADSGRGKIAATIESFDKAAAAYKRAAIRLQKEKELAKHRDLANELAWQLATSKNKLIYNPKLAFDLLPALQTWYSHVDTAAAVYAANGDFKQARKLQEEAIAGINADDAEQIYLRYNGLNENNLFLQLGLKFVNSGMKSQFLERLELYEKNQVYRE
ncbi:MAG: hypothetical protein J0M26_01270 [Planctomycetes bacterium]|nr:hypothetical protein [Planctomycetota bacterium]